MLNRSTVPDLPAGLDIFIIWDIRSNNVTSIARSRVFSERPEEGVFFKVIYVVLEVHV